MLVISYTLSVTLPYMEQLSAMLPECSELRVQDWVLHLLHTLGYVLYYFS